MSDLLQPTPIADHDHPRLQALIEARGWRTLDPFARIGAVYDFVRDEVRFGYNRADDLPVSAVLADGYGQCNTKGNLLLALLRGSGIPARFHGFTIDKALQKGAIPACTPAPDLQEPAIDWQGAPTFIQKEGIAEDFGVFDSPDAFYAGRGTGAADPQRNAGPATWVARAPGGRMVRTFGALDPARVLALSSEVEAHHTTEDVVRYALANGYSVDVVQQDEYTLDVLLDLGDVTLVYDTT